MQWKGIAKYSAIAVGILLLSILAVGPLFIPDEDTPEYRMEGAYFDVQGKGVWVTSRVGEERFQVMMDGEWTDIVIKGVNIGAAKPGYFPGEAAITYEEYVRWFEWIGEMNANAVRIYTHHPPDFYRALLEYNKAHKDPIYLFQGTTLDEIGILECQDTYNSSITSGFHNNIMMAVDIIHGNAEIEKKVGMAYGSYTHDVSDFVLGFVHGIEFDAGIVVGTNEKNMKKGQFDGRFFRTVGASPFEIWLAEMMEFGSVYEYDLYSCQRPLSFVNWPTTDPLDHPYEPNIDEDRVGVDPNHISSKMDFYPGQFASYHVYPYYPDFMNHEPHLFEYVNSMGRISNYAGYLHDLREVHSIPILIAEYGTPSSRGNAHTNVLGLNHGQLTEWEQGQHDSMLFSDMIDEGCAGGLLFSWQNEWFKRAWNTMDYMNPGRRPYWSDQQTCEQHFGMLSFDPVSDHRILLDGSMEDWEGVSPTGLSNDVRYNQYFDGYDSGRDLEALYVHHDAANLYLRVSYSGLKGQPEWDRMNTCILLDTVQGQGAHELPLSGGIGSDRGIDLAIHLDGDGSRVMVDAYYDVNHYDYAVDELVIPQIEYANDSQSGQLHPILLTVNRGYYIREIDHLQPYESYETGLLRWGVSDPDRYDYDSLADINYGEDSIEMRIPWLLLNFRDPSRKEVVGDLWKDGLGASQRIEGIHLAVLTWKPDGNGNGTKGTNSPPIADSIPLPVDGRLLEEEFMFYTWENWDIPAYRERLKESYYLMQETYGRY